MTSPADETLSINTLRLLAADMVEQAKSGHPGLPLEAAEIGYVLWTRVLRHNPANPSWPDRDRFVLSAGHGSALLYALLYLSGYNLPLEQLRQFRQWGSLTPGHPEFGLTPGVETTTGPLGQGFANAVGMAAAEQFLGSRFNREGFKLIDHRTYALCSDGDFMEGIASEAASLAGHLKLHKLTAIYLDNQVSLEGPTRLAFSENVAQRFAAYGWRVLRIDGHDVQAVSQALAEARAEQDQPVLIDARTHIGLGSPHKQDTAAAHGEPLGAAELRLVKEHFGFSPDASFAVFAEALADFRAAAERGRAAESAWEAQAAAYAAAHPDAYAEYRQALRGELPEGWEKVLPVFPADKPLATREASGQVLNALAPYLPLLVGGSADLAPSTMTLLKAFPDFSSQEHGGSNFHFGVREHAMAGMLNGMALHGGLRVYGATFLTFSDYLRPSLRLSALMKLPVIFVFTHDSVGMGEDGPTHQPVEQLMSLRLIPNLTVIRPADAQETVQAWRLALTLPGPVALVLSRQKLPVLDPSRYVLTGQVAKGGYVLSPEVGAPAAVLMATGSEVSLALAAQALLARQGISVRVVSLPSWELFRAQPKSYRDEVLPPRTKARLALEAGVTSGWREWVGDNGDVLGLDHFGASAPGKVVQEKFGFTPEHAAQRVLALLGRQA
ncbi:MAG: transketolase [Candidatus Firestonebacteria bacterium]|nr:transketolase [Candidatus Firestonebacteria bacterium]